MAWSRRNPRHLGTRALDSVQSTLVASISGRASLEHYALRLTPLPPNPTSLNHSPLPEANSVKIIDGPLGFHLPFPVADHLSSFFLVLVATLESLYKESPVVLGVPSQPRFCLSVFVFVFFSL